MQSFSSRIWTRVAVSISYDDNHYTTGTSGLIIKINRFTSKGLDMRMIVQLEDSFTNLNNRLDILNWKEI